MAGLRDDGDLGAGMPQAIEWTRSRLDQESLDFLATEHAPIPALHVYHQNVLHVVAPKALFSPGLACRSMFLPVSYQVRWNCDTFFLHG